MATVNRSKLEAILDAVQAQLASVTGIDTSHIRRLARHQRKLPAPLDGQRELLLRIRGFWAERVKHRDRHDCRIARKLSVIVRCRTELDEQGGDEVLIGADTDDDKGLDVTENSVIDALQNFYPEDEDGNHLTYESLSIMDGTDYDVVDGHPGWGQVELLFAVPIQLPLDQERI